MVDEVVSWTTPRRTGRPAVARRARRAGRVRGPEGLRARVQDRLRGSARRHHRHDGRRRHLPPDSIPLLLYVLVEEKLDFITARRWYREGGQAKSPIRLLGNAILSGAMMCLFFKFIIDSQSGMWASGATCCARSGRAATAGPLRGAQDLRVHHRELRCLEMPIYTASGFGTKQAETSGATGFGNLFLPRPHAPSFSAGAAVRRSSLPLPRPDEGRPGKRR